MKKLLLLTLVLSLSLAQVMRADNDNETKKRRRAAQAAQSHPGQSARPARPAVHQPAARPRPYQAQQFVTPTQRGVSRVQPSRQVTTRNHNIQSNRSNVSVARQPNRGNRNFNRNSFSIARSHVIRVSHDRTWWRARYNTTFVLFGGGYYYWWNNYWYPAFGYSPIYNTYAYDEPIYGYNNLAPGQVIENVQIALRDQGYNPGAIDGDLGPQTRAALADYQRDQGLVVTSAIDEPTLVTLGLA
ncbi:MAG: peptidoglycan-binding domain-containing protein [Chthoniobacterales bacterium]